MTLLLHEFEVKPRTSVNNEDTQRYPTTTVVYFPPKASIKPKSGHIRTYVLYPVTFQYTVGDLMLIKIINGQQHYL